MDKYLSQIHQRLGEVDASGVLHQDTVQTILSLFRQHLEANKQKKQYPSLMFYCNWSLHVSLDKGIVQDILDKISAVFVDPHEKDPVATISEILSLRSLRSEIKTILGDAGIRPGLFDTYAGWKAFLGQMVKALLEKPLKRKRNSSIAICAETLELYVCPPGVSLAYRSPSVTEDTVFWRVWAMPKGVTITGPFQITERPEAFSRPS